MKYALITGCSNNSIGSGLAIAFSAHPNVHIFATSRKLSTMSSLSSITNITLVELDVTSPSSIATALTTITSQTSGKLDYLLNYAGTGYTMSFLDTNIDVAKRMYDVNIWGVLRVTQAFAPLVIATKGIIVMAGSTAELANLPFQSAYCASKAALLLLSETLRVEVQPFGVKVMYVTTGFVESNWFSNVPKFELPKDSIYQPIAKEIEFRAKGQQDVKWMKTSIYAERVVRDVLAGKQGRVYRGEAASLFGWVLPWLPQWVMDRLLRNDTGINILEKRLGEEKA